ncbi:Cloroperoxidase [Fomitopsis serialis]|uniref:Cloroperoxidase n=1 Tax=Fomitopsis serialis TaxID=139415 RepID=UPI0020086E26|nr:Cloroperoxidase [Neoantrodia serialis]KAH9938278.1 Cloroperoxidase [Neoantrodia serialis]
MSSFHDRTYSPPSPGASRSPCPALNALANHGYLPRDGRGITAVQLIRALVQVYNFSVPLAVVLSVVGVVLCGNWWSLDLHQLAKHGLIEHNGSLAHDDTPPHEAYAPTAVDPKLVHQLLSVTSAPYLTLRDFAKARALRDSAIPTPLDRVHAEIARGEAVLTIQTFGLKSKDTVGSAGELDGAVMKTFLEQWLGQERLPEGWQKSQTPIGLVETASRSRQIEKMIRELRTNYASCR